MMYMMMKSIHISLCSFSPLLLFECMHYSRSSFVVLVLVVFYIHFLLLRHRRVNALPVLPEPPRRPALHSLLLYACDTAVLNLTRSTRLVQSR